MSAIPVQLRQFGLRVFPPQMVCLWRHIHKSPACAPKQTLPPLAAQFLIIMFLSACAFRRRKLVVRSPRKKPRFHVLVSDKVAGFLFAVCPGGSRLAVVPGRPQRTQQPWRSKNSSYGPNFRLAWPNVFFVCGFNRTLRVVLRVAMNTL